jgi:hypothetical protein
MPRRKSDAQAKRAFTDGCASASAVTAVEARPIQEDRHIQAPHAREAEPLKDGEKHDHLAAQVRRTGDRQEALLDEALEETFPGSDPISPKHIT